MRLQTIATGKHVTRINLDSVSFVTTGTSFDGHGYIELGIAHLPEIDEEELLEGVRVYPGLVTVYDNFEGYDAIYEAIA